MRTIRIALLALCGVAAAAQPRRRPRFEDYPVREVFRGRPAAVDLASADGARRFRTVLRGAAQAGPKFAGHYGVAEWGCGSPCQMMAIADLRTGRVAFAPRPATVGYAYRADSRLLIVDPPEAWKNAPMPNGWASFYRWTGSAFVPLDSVRMTAR